MARKLYCWKPLLLETAFAGKPYCWKPLLLESPIAGIPYCSETLFNPIARKPYCAEILLLGNPITPPRAEMATIDSTLLWLPPHTVMTRIDPALRSLPPSRAVIARIQRAVDPTLNVFLRVKRGALEMRIVVSRE